MCSPRFSADRKHFVYVIVRNRNDRWAILQSIGVRAATNSKRFCCKLAALLCGVASASRRSCCLSWPSVIRRHSENNNTSDESAGRASKCHHQLWRSHNCWRHEYKHERLSACEQRRLDVKQKVKKQPCSVSRKQIYFEESPTGL